MYTFWPYPHPRLSTAIVQLIICCILFYFLQTALPKLFISLSSSTITQFPSLTTKPTGFKSSYNFLLILCLCPPLSFPIPKQSSPVSATCRLLGTPYLHFLPLLPDKPFTTSVCYALGKRSWATATDVLYPSPVPPTNTPVPLDLHLYCKHSGPRTALLAFSIQQLAQQDINTILYSFSTLGNTFLLRVTEH